jgi:SAP domain-containing ribonucleoprotein
MPEYAEMKNADLQALLKTRGLPAAGKKADLVERLTKDDEQKNAAQRTEPAASAEKPSAAQDEDQIEWDEDDEPAPASEKPTEPATTAEETVAKAGGEGLLDNPQAVPNQVADIDPSKTADLSVKSPGEEKTEDAAEEKVEEKKEPPPDYTKGLAASNIDEEIEKRKKRAIKFGQKIEDDEGLKKLERMKKFGETGPPKGLDEALPERPLKRGRDANDQGGRGGRNNKRRGGDKFGGGRRGPANRDGDRRRDDNRPRDDNRARDNIRSNNGGSWMSEADRQKAEERKKKFTQTPA